ncbi:MAG: hypothetical protein KC446_03515, partial [Flavobacteriales bacterium]|nr:hypothetical protein [Flavobacteriales bacterium]
ANACFMTFVKNFVWLVLVLFVQWGLLQDVPLTVFGNPYLYLWFFLWLPFGVSRISLYAIAFAVGSIMDAFEQSGGAHTLACLTLVALKPWVENALIGYRKSDDNEGVSHLALAPYLTTSGVLVLLHHTVLFTAENYGFDNPLLLITRILISSLITLVLLAITHALFSKKYAA